METSDYIVDESPEISIGERRWISKKFFDAFPAFVHRNYQLYFGGQLVSLIGFWLQQVAQGWLVLQLTHSAFWVGVIGALGTIPMLLFGLFAGVIIDRVPNKLLLMFCQASALILVGMLGFLTLTETITISALCIIVFLLGTVNALDMPVRQSFAIKMVGRKDLSSAIALNAGMFNAARVIGPSIAGILIGIVGLSGAFLINTVTYIPILIALFFMKIHEPIESNHPHPFTAIKQGLQFSFSHPVIRPLLLLTAVSSIFGWTTSTIMPVVIEQVFHESVSMLGFFYAATGLGAILATVIVSLYYEKISPFTFIVWGNILFALSMFVFTLTQYIPLALFFLFLSGLGLLVQFSTMNSAIQHMVDDSKRGRVMSIYVLMFIGVMPFGSFLVGFLAEHFGSPFSIQFGAVILFAVGLFLLTQRKKLDHYYSAHLISHKN